MPPIVALLLCTAFVLFLLRLDCKQAPGVSSASWIPTLWMLCAASKPLIYWFHPLGSEGEESNYVDPSFHSLLLAAGFFTLAQRRVAWRGFFRDSGWIVALLAFMLLSIAWSGTILVAFKRWIRELEAVLMAVLVLSDRSPRQAMESILRRTAYVLIPTSLMVIKFFPVQGVQYGRWTGSPMWVGVTLQKNGLGRLCLIAVAFLLWSLFTRRKRAKSMRVKYSTAMDWVVLLIAVWLLKGPTVQAYSATALAALFLGLATFGGLYWIQKRRLYFIRGAVTGLVMFGIAVGTALPFVMGKESDPEGASQSEVTAMLGRDASFTGRTDIWAQLLPDVKRNPLLGAGLFGYWTPANVIIHEVGEAHNGYLDMLLHLGAVGLSLAGVILISSCRKALRALDIDFDWASLVASFVVMITFHNISESSIHCFTCTLSGLLVLLIASFPAALSRPRRSVAHLNPTVRPSNDDVSARDVRSITSPVDV